jgi:hypothetical protein
MPTLFPVHILFADRLQPEFAGGSDRRLAFPPAARK